MNILDQPSLPSYLNRSLPPMNSLQSETFKHKFLWHGIFICTLAFIIGLFIPLYANPRAGMAAHVLGITEGMFLAIIGFAYPQLKLSFFLARSSFWMLIISAYVGLFGQFLSAAFGLKRILVITGVGMAEGNLWMETGVEIATKAISVLLIVACAIVLFGLRRSEGNFRAPGAPGTEEQRKLEPRA
jgi:hydroxylaminobenzene mutase